MDQITQILNQLSLANEDQRMTILQELMPALSASSRADLQRILQDLNFAIVFDCLNSSNEEEIETTCEVLGKILAQLEPAFVLERYSQPLIRGLNHPNPNVKIIILNELQRFSQNMVGIQDLTSNHGLILPAASYVGSDKLSVAQASTTLLITIGKRDAGLLFSAPLFDLLQELSSNNNASIRFRIYDIIVQVAKESPKHLERCKLSNLLGKIISEAFENDVLVQLNSLELLTELASVEHGLEYLNTEGISKRLDSFLNEASTNPLSNLLVPGIIKYFGNVAHFNPKALTDFPSFNGYLFMMIKEGDMHEKCLGVETFGVIGQSLKGKTTLHGLGEKMNDIINTITELVKRGKTEEKIRALTVLTDLISLSDEERSEETMALTESTFVSFNNEAMKYLFELSKQPFTDLREAILKVFLAMSSQSWGAKRFQNQPGFMEYLFDRDAANDKTAKELKYEIIKNASEVKDALAIFGTPVLIRLKQYVKEGPFYVKAQAEVATEGTG